MPRAQKGERFGGRGKGTRNKATLQREELARAQLAQALENSKKAGNASPRVAMDELYKALQIAEGFAGTVQPQPIRDAKTGKVTFQGGDVELFGAWFDRYKDCIGLLLPYQNARMKPVDAPAAAPSEAEKEVASRKKFGLRVFEGGRQVQPLGKADAS